MRKQTLVAAVVFGLAGALAAWLVYRSGSSGELLTDIVIAGVSACIVGGLLWSKVALKQTAAASVRRGALVGALIGFVSHPVYWYIWAVYSWAFQAPGVGGPAMGPLHGLWGALLVSLLSWVVAGWITVPLGAVVGGALAAIGPKPQTPAQTP